MGESTHVQTELSAEKYRQFKSLAEEQNISLTAALREAAVVWMKQQRVDPDDPLFEILDREPLPDKPRTNASTEDDVIDEWSRATAGIHFADTASREE